jgi:hypothetical protein
VALSWEIPDPRLDAGLRTVISLCRSWLRWRDPSKATLDGLALDPRVTLLLNGRIAPLAQRYDQSRGAGVDRTGCYRVALREAQMHWAAKLLPPMLSDGAFLSRSRRQEYQIRWDLRRQHPDAWRAWEMQHPVSPVDTMRETCAVLMAERLGEDLY